MVILGCRVQAPTSGFDLETISLGECRDVLCSVINSFKLCVLDFS